MSHFYTLAAAGFLILSQAALADQAEHGTHAHTDGTFAAGEPGDKNLPARRIEIVMRETPTGMAFTPDQLSVSKDEQVEFVLENKGALEHEFVLDTASGNQRHKLTMEKTPEMEHEEPNEIRLDPGHETTFLWRFTKPGTFEFACLIPGHYEAGMHGTLIVK